MIDRNSNKTYKDLEKNELIRKTLKKLSLKEL